MKQLANRLKEIIIWCVVNDKLPNKDSKNTKEKSMASSLSRMINKQKLEGAINFRNIFYEYKKGNQKAKNYTG